MFPLHNYLYHYTKCETAIDYILPSMTLRMSPFTNVNDLREAKSWNFTLYSRGQQAIDGFKSHIFDDISRCITSRSLMLCAAMDDPSLVDAKADDKNLRSGYGHPRMWAQYGDNHKGVCIVIDKDAIHKTITDALGSDGLYYGPVTYVSSEANPRGRAYHLAYIEDILESGIDNFLEPHIKTNHRDLFFTKHLDWRDECEYRWVFRSRDGLPIFIPIASCIKAIILGGDCGQNEANKIMTICASSKISLYRIHQLGWSLSLLPEDHKNGDALTANLSFSTSIPCSSVFVQARDYRGRNRPIRIDNEGNVMLIDQK